MQQQIRAQKLAQEQAASLVGTGSGSGAIWGKSDVSHGSSAANATGRKLSMQEIIAEEQKKSSSSIAEGVIRPAGGSWANKIGGGTGGLPSMAAVVTPNPTPAPRVEAVKQTSSVPAPAATRASKTAEVPIAAPVATGADFGTKGMGRAMSEWCQQQLKVVAPNSGADLTLMEFLYSLQSPVEIREYMGAYLGSSPQISAFTTEFIKRKASNS